MSEEIYDSDFYREDFSTCSEWEDYNAQLCEIFQNWNLAEGDWGRLLLPNELYNCKWEMKSEMLEILNRRIQVSYYAAKLKELEGEDGVVSHPKPDGIAEAHLDLMALDNTFGPPTIKPDNWEIHPVARYYGLRRFVVLHPTDPLQCLKNPSSDFCFFRSTTTVVAAEICCTVPIFVQVYDPNWQYFMGVCVAPSLRISFDLVALETAPTTCRHLSGFLAMFKEKYHHVAYKRPVTVSVQNTYLWETIKVHVPLCYPFAESQDQQVKDSKLCATQYTALPIGYFSDSYSEIFLVCSWPAVGEDIVIDTELRSEFLPSKAPSSAVYQVTQGSAYLSSCLDEFIKLSGAPESLESYLGRDFSGIASGSSKSFKSYNNLMKIWGYEKNPTIPLKMLPGPINENQLEGMLQYLLPSVFSSTEHPFPYTKSVNKFDPLRIKSAYPDSLVCRLSCLLATVYSHFGGKHGVAQLWATVIVNLRICVDNCIRIPGIASGFPDTRTCLLHQKLQMLNVCMNRRELRERSTQQQQQEQRNSARADTSSHHDKEKYDVAAAKVVDKDEEDENEEFFDCVAAPQLNASTASSDAGLKLPLDEPEGQQCRLGDLKLLYHSDVPLFVPFTQEPVPKTEDQLHADAEVMLRLGPGSELTTQMMCSALLSDMEAFKAANPQAALEDFIRWYSPKDWLENTTAEGETEGQLSARMLAPGNTWQTVWKQAQPVPVRRQKRLFDETSEALKVLHFLETRCLGEICELALMPLLHSAVLKLQNTYEHSGAGDLFAARCATILSDICRLSRDVEIIGHNEIGAVSGTPNPMPIIDKIKALEMDFYQFICFAHKFSSHPEAMVRSWYAAVLRDGFSYTISPRDQQEKLISKEYVLRVDGETTTMATLGAGQTEGPQFMRAILSGDELRLCAAFSENTTFV